MARPAAIVLVVVVAALAACQAAAPPPPGVSREVADYCTSHGYAPVDSESFDWCTVNFSFSGNRQDLNPWPVGNIRGS